MKQSTWRLQHKWTGIALCFFLVMFCLSGIVLNHRPLFTDVNVSRRLLPPWYRFRQWNNGLLRGTIPIGTDSVLLYGAGGVFLTDPGGRAVSDYNKGLPTGADRRAMRAVVASRDGHTLYAVSQFGLFTRETSAASWTEIPLCVDGDERLSDLTLQGDTLVAVGRSHLYVAILRDRAAPSFRQVDVGVPVHFDERVSLFKTVWRLHSGELFGLAGKIVVDILAVVLLFLSVTGILCWLLPACARRIGKGARHVLRWTFHWHNRIGRLTILLTILLVLSGWCLRPPLMVPLVLNRTQPLTHEAPWHDKLRALRYDSEQGDWLLYTSDGFFALPSLQAPPRAIEGAPAVSVMGINVWERDGRGAWLCGSFSGMTVWERSTGALYDYFTGLPVTPGKGGPPFGAMAVSGYTADIGEGAGYAVGYGAGTDALPQPAGLRGLPMSLWNVALEVHTGRIYFADAATWFFVFLCGLLTLWCLWSGWRIRRK